MNADLTLARDAQAFFVAALLGGVVLAVLVVRYRRLRRAMGVRRSRARGPLRGRADARVSPLRIMRGGKSGLDRIPASVRARALGVDELSIDEYALDAEFTGRVN